MILSISFRNCSRTNEDAKEPPQRLKRKFLETRTSEATVAARILLDHGGFKAWITYFLATEGKAHFKGRHDRFLTIAAFQKLPLGDRINVARRIAGDCLMSLAIHQ